MGSLRRTTVVPCAPQAVFEFLTVPENARRVMRGVTRFEALDPGPMRLGSRFLQTRVVHGIPASANVEVVAFEPGHRLALAGGARGVDVRFEYRLAPEQAGTRVDMTCDVAATGTLRLFMPLIAAMVEREEGEHLERLARLLSPAR